MQRQVIHRDYQQQTAGDHNNQQDYAREALDTLIADAVSNARRYADLTVSKIGQVEVAISPGRVYDGGEVYARRTTLTQSMSTYTAAAGLKIVVVSAYGQEVETDSDTRSFVIDVKNLTTEPRASTMTRSREAQIVITAGADGADPNPPAIPATHVALAHIVMDTTQVVSVTMLTANAVASTAALDARSDSLELFRSQIEPRVASLSSDLASLQNRVNAATDQDAFNRIMFDLARVKEALRFPDTASDFGADFYLLPEDSDTADAAGLGYDAKVEEGVRFADANASEFEISLFSANDPNAALKNGILLPKHSQEVKVSTGVYDSELGIAQYGFQTVEMKQGYMSRSRLRYGGGRTVCSNGHAWDTTSGRPAGQNLYDYETQNLTTSETLRANGSYTWNRRNTYWFDTWKEPFMYAVTVDQTINGAMVAQTFLASNDMWATQLGIFITAKGADEDIHVALCEVIAGVPDLEKTIMKTVYPHASIVNGWNQIPIPYTALQKGRRYGLVLVSNANLKIGMAAGQGFLDGTFFYSTDGIYYQGNLTKDMMLQVWGAKFDNAQVAIEFSAINLDGGLRDIDILAEQWVTDACELVFELRPGGTGEWLPLTADNLNVLNSAPALCQFRARFVGTRDMQPALTLTGSRVRVSRPKTAFKHVSTPITLGTASDTITVELLAENFDETPHDFSCELRVGATDETADTTVTTLLDADEKRYKRTFTFNLPSPETEFRIVIDGTTTGVTNIFHVAERVHYAT